VLEDFRNLPSFALQDSGAGDFYMDRGCRFAEYLRAKQNAPDSLLSLGRLLISPPPSAARGLL